MATKVIILGEEPKEVKQLKPIEFVKFLSSDIISGDDPSPPQIWRHVDLVVKNYTTDGLDIMLAYDDDKYKYDGALYLGHYNDGVKEVKPLKPIEFVEVLGHNASFKPNKFLPKHFKTIELVCRNYNQSGFDLMFVYDYDRNQGLSVLGHFNDEIVE
ncbi:MAG: hypothetical protein IM600_18650 [Bacteroidetes bacterium]|nr:hypothetical protein [Bacteroidota bacterium]